MLKCNFGAILTALLPSLHQSQSGQRHEANSSRPSSGVQLSLEFRLWFEEGFKRLLDSESQGRHDRSSTANWEAGVPVRRLRKAATLALNVFFFVWLESLPTSQATTAADLTVKGSFMATREHHEILPG